LVIVSQTLSRPVIINTNRHYDYDIFNRQINIHLDIKSLISNDAIVVWVSNHQFLSLVLEWQAHLSGNRIMWIESRMLWTALFTIYLMQIVYQNQWLNVPQWKSTSNALTFLVELSSAACCKSVLSKISGYHRSTPMGMVFMFPGNYCIEEGNTINKLFLFHHYYL
jgi:hypothetical protein